MFIELTMFIELNKYMKLYECQNSVSLFDLCPSSLKFRHFGIFFSGASQISYGASIGPGNKYSFTTAVSHYEDGHDHAHICKNFKDILLRNRMTDIIDTV